MFADPEYYAKPFGSRTWQLAKFEGSKQPIAVYWLEKRAERWQCSCPGFRGHGHCKHPAMLQNFINRRLEPTL